MELFKFIQKNNNWRELLSKDPYNLIIKDYSGTDKDFKDLTIFSYNQLETDFSYQLCKEARGVIIEFIDNKPTKIVCRAFDRFFNHGEVHADQIDWSTAKVLTKLDGSIIKVWNYRDQWRISTNNSINALETPLHDKNSLVKNTTNTLYSTFGELAQSLINERDFQYKNKDYTYIFELCSPFNRVVTPWDKPQLFYIGCRNNDLLGEEFLPEPYDFSFSNIGIPTYHDFYSFTDVVNKANTLDFKNEGYVIVDSKFRRNKIKSPAYVAAHHLLNNGVLTVKSVLNMIETGESEEYLTYYPENISAFEVVQFAISRFESRLHNVWSEYFHHKDFFKSRRELALYYKDYEYKDFIFKLASDETLKVKDYINNMLKSRYLNIIESTIEEMK